jgi:protein phosphatase
MLDSFGLSDPGRVRALNEDSFALRPDLGFFAVCDGLGGHNAGEVASRITLETMIPFIEASHTDTEITWPFGLMMHLSFDGNRLFTAIGLGNKRVFREADAKREYAKMGSTALAAIVRDPVLTVAWLGDSRAYLLRGGTIERVTEDHTWVNAAVKAGIVRPEEADRHVWKDVLTKAVGSQDTCAPDVTVRTLEGGDHVLLCSDGLTKMVEEERIVDLVAAARSLEEAAKALVGAANEAGGKDNVTVVLLRYTA